MPKYAATSFYLTPVKKLHNETKEFYKKLNSIVTPFFTPFKVPIGMKDVKDHLSTCFELVTEETASLDTTFQGKGTETKIPISFSKYFFQRMEN